MDLLIDLGNTRLKWATLDAGVLRPGGVFAHGDVALDAALAHEWGRLARVARVFAASVRGADEERRLDAYAHARFGQHVRFVRSPAQALGIRNAYAQPGTLGVDRFLALAALHAQDARPQVLASVGTALTVDALAADGTHLGGIILPSPTLMRASLHARTARIPPVDGHWHALPESTADGVHAGSLYAAAGAIDRFVAAAAARMEAAPSLFVTGGGAEELLPLLPTATRVHDLVLRGLARWAEADAG